MRSDILKQTCNFQLRMHDHLVDKKIDRKTPVPESYF